jgi:hypothetical protein
MVTCGLSGPTIKVEVWNKPTPEDAYASYIELTLISDDASFTYRMEDLDAENLIGYLKQALEYSRAI